MLEQMTRALLPFSNGKQIRNDRFMMETEFNVKKL
ncbi:hypothetical protein AVDCRST_MAG81-3508 [uncultured Synechococcales cyanobacterium]|uniref:Uncharacterized protein n=1 Tax=uncultured Synechococcales cyanobacterium TaxID=1936017 RepID=A0A6J4VPZ2_9CYAN|nr:hypothetical protein AVDCRST_MAG81-3508 [uncultured Synechococcales cyanobacterium]